MKTDGFERFWQGVRKGWQAVLGVVWKCLEVLFGGLILGAIVWVLLASVVWPIELQTVVARSFPLEGGYTLHARSPAAVPADGQSVAIELFVQANGSQPDPAEFAVLVTLPATLEVTGSPAQRQVTLLLSAAAPQTLPILNARTTGGFASAREAVLLSVVESGQPIGQIALTTESVGRAVLRRFGGGGGNGQLPLAPLATILFSAFGLYLQERRQRQLESEKKRERAKALLNEFRDSFRDPRTAGARGHWEKIRREGLESYLDPHEKETGERLLQIMDGDLGAAGDVQQLREMGLRQAAGALLYALQHAPVDREGLARALRSFPVEELDQELRAPFFEAGSIFHAGPAQYCDWPRRPASRSWPKLPAGFAGFPARLANPFSCERAEDNLAFLFRSSKPLFWFEDPLVEKIQDAAGLTHVVGAAGSGKTTLALAVGAYGIREPVMSCYLYGRPEAADIRAGFARRFCDFIQQTPSYLVKVSPGGRGLLAQLLVEALGRNVARTELDRVSWEWLERAGRDETRRAIWKAETRAQIRLLREEVERIEASPVFHDSQWAHALALCARELDFPDRLYLAIDTGAGLDQDWMQRVIMSQRAAWRQAGIRGIVFSLPGRRTPDLDWDHELELTWRDGTRDLLADLVQWYWDESNRPHHLPDLFAEGGFQALLLESKHNPGRFMRLWNALVALGPGKKIDRPLIEKAKGSL